MCYHNSSQLLTNENKVRTKNICKLLLHRRLCLVTCIIRESNPFMEDSEISYKVLTVIDNFFLSRWRTAEILEFSSVALSYAIKGVSLYTLVYMTFEKESEM